MPAIIKDTEDKNGVNRELRLSNGELFNHEDMMAAARIELLRRAPFFGTLLVNHPLIAVPANHPYITTAGTDSARIYYNPLFMLLIGREGRVFVLAHEVAHIATDVFLRRGERIPMIWNFAADFVVNDMLIKGGLKMPNQGDIQKSLATMVQKFGWTEEQCSEYATNMGLSDPQKIIGLHDPKYSGMAHEEIYEDLIDKAKKQLKQLVGKGQSQKGQKGQGQKGQGADGSDPGDEDGDQDGQGKDERSFEQQLADALGMGTLDRHMMEELADEEDLYKASQQVRQAIQTMESAGIGNVPAQIKTLLKAYDDHKFNWRDILRCDAMNRVPNDYSWQRLERSAFQRGISIPSITYDEYLRVGMAVDTSGSMSDDDLRKVLTEILGIARQFSHFEMTLIQADYQISAVHQFDNENMEELATFTFEGRGGTSYRGPFMYLDEHCDDYDWVIFFTDGGGDGWFEEYAGRLPNFVWLIVNNPTTPTERPSWGRVIEFDRYA